jgi:hypothetical protein
MTDTQKLKALIDEFHSLDSTPDSIRMQQILEEAIPEVDRTKDPKKWAGLYGLLGRLREGIDPRGALEAYRKCQRRRKNASIFRNKNTQPCAKRAGPG